MADWNPQQYLQFERQRTQPCRDLIAHIALDSPARIVDLGCGPGNSTQALWERWPDAEIMGIDSSPEMIAAAAKSNERLHWDCQDIAVWARQNTQTFELVFSNAALQWVPDHAGLLPQLFQRVARGGVLAIQVPGNLEAPPHQAMRDLAASEKWRSSFPVDGVREWLVQDIADYYDMLAPLTTHVELWATDYLHVLPSVEAIVEWYKGTGLRPFLAHLSTPEAREAFLADYLNLLRGLFVPRTSRAVLFPFRRIFMVAERSADTSKSKRHGNR